MRSAEKRRHRADLIKHQHDHPRFRDLTARSSAGSPSPTASPMIFARLIGSWIFVLAQTGIMVLWVGSTP